MFSNFLNSRHDLCKELVNRLLKKYEYVSILGKHIKGRSIGVSSFDVDIGDTYEAQCGFVVRLYNGKCFSEYSFSDITEQSINQLEQDIYQSANLDKDILMIETNIIALHTLTKLYLNDMVKNNSGHILNVA